MHRFIDWFNPWFPRQQCSIDLAWCITCTVAIGIPLSAAAGIIVATGVVHTFLGYIPSALIGAPGADTALALLPGHRMLLSGNAPKGVAYSARGSQLGLFLSLPLIVAARIAFGQN